MTLLKYQIVFLTALCTPVLTLAQELSIDHVISINADLDKSIENYASLGFSIKKGTLHKTGLINAHIKFKNASSFELMSIQGEPKDAIAQQYKLLLNKKIKGAYVAFTGLPLNQIQSVLENSKIQFEITPGKLWTYVSFPSHSEFAHIFFIIYHIEQTPSTAYITHSNGFDCIENITLEGTQNFIHLFKNLGLTTKNTSLAATKFQTKTGSLTVQLTNHGERPRIKEVSFGKRNAKDTLKIKLD